MKKKVIWVRTTQTWIKEGREDLVVIGDHRKDETNWERISHDFTMRNLGWELVDKKEEEIIQEYWLPDLTGVA